MRTTVRLDDALLDQAREEAQKRGETLTSLVEKGLRLQLAHSKPSTQRRRVLLPVSKAGGGVMPGVDLDNSAALCDILDDVR